MRRETLCNNRADVILRSLAIEPPAGNEADKSRPSALEAGLLNVARLALQKPGVEEKAGLRSTDILRGLAYRLKF
jgi:hypothetical protein